MSNVWERMKAAWIVDRRRKVGGHVGKGRTQRSYGSGLTGTVERVCPGGRHAWLNTVHGLRRKPYEG
jgi:hypothetical protein